MIDWEGAYCAQVRQEDMAMKISDEIRKWCDSADVDGDACGKPRELAEQIRRLAAKEDKR